MTHELFIRKCDVYIIHIIYDEKQQIFIDYFVLIGGARRYDVLYASATLQLNKLFSDSTYFRRTRVHYTRVLL